MKDSIHIKYCESGIIKVIVNTKERWCDYTVWRETDTRFVFDEKDEEGFSNRIYSFDIDLCENVLYTRFDDQEKDQTYLHFIPKYLLD